MAAALRGAVGGVGGAIYLNPIKRAAAQDKCAAFTQYYPPYMGWSVEEGPNCLA
ncbi:hypothetical protein ACGH2B_26565 [Streptomyces sp. BBFR2]|uniref:hypothetical protein n=1 Tax=Streptomyces sp. BBFR2 TaxID=3372854 RepID=UPI0037DA3E96